MQCRTPCHVGLITSSNLLGRQANAICPDGMGNQRAFDYTSYSRSPFLTKERSGQIQIKIGPFPHSGRLVRSKLALDNFVLRKPH